MACAIRSTFGIIELLERETGGRRDVGKADASHRRLQVIEPALGGEASDFRADATHRPARIDDAAGGRSSSATLR